MAYESKDKPRDPNEKPSDAPAPGNDEAQKVADQETKQGYRGVEVDETPNEEYTVAGVTKAAKNAK